MPKDAERQILATRASFDWRSAGIGGGLLLLWTLALGLAVLTDVGNFSGVYLGLVLSAAVTFTGTVMAHYLSRGIKQHLTETERMQAERFDETAEELGRLRLEVAAVRDAFAAGKRMGEAGAALTVVHPRQASSD